VTTGDIVSQFFKDSPITTIQTRDITETKVLDVVTNTWNDKVQVNRVVKASDTGGKIEAKQIDFSAGEVAGSVISGGNGNDDIKGFAGWDIIDGGAGDDLIHGGNGRDILTGGTGRDELHGDFGWNTYRSERDGVSDLVAIKSDQFLVNWLYGKAGNSPNGEKSDIIEGLDAIDKIRIIGVDTSEITFAANVITKGVTGIGIYGKGILEALYTGGDLTLAQIQSMTSGDASEGAFANTITKFGSW
jgi:Ca2+-binding RTX toxin-like protein